MWKRRCVLAAAMILAVWMAGCATAPKTDAKKQTLEADAVETIARFKEVDPSMSERFFETAKAYAVFPTIGKGAIGVGGAYGRGVLYEGAAVTGYCDMTQASIGLQLGGQAYSEIVFFETDSALRDFKAGDLQFAAQASAVAANADASTNADYDHGVAVFTLAAKGLMYEASIGGQRFTYVRK